jgi:thiol:disulfide interchange protein DsbD
MRTQDFNLNKSVVRQVEATSEASSSIKPVKYTDILESEVPGVNAFFDYDEALQAAKQLKKPLMIDFTGHSCANCRKMEQEVLSDPEIMKRLQQDFVVVSLYVDDKFKLPENEWYKAKDGSQIKSLGTKNLDFEITLTQNGAQPQYVFVDGNGNIIKNAGGYVADIKRFINILDEVKAGYKP